MWFKHRAWIAVAWIGSAVNVAAVWFAARPAEPLHATGHALLAVLLALGARRLMARQQSEALGAELQRALDDNEHLQLSLEELQPRLQELEERLDFSERLLAQQRNAERPGG